VLEHFRGLLPVTWRMVLRNAVRNKARAFLTITGVAAGTAVLYLGLSSMDLFEEIVQHQFYRVDRSDLRVDFAAERPPAALVEVAGTPEVLRAEPLLQIGAEVRSGRRVKDVAIIGLPPEADLYHVFGPGGRRMRLPEQGLLVPRRLARELGVRRGEKVQVDPYLKDRDEVPMPVRGFTDEYVGLNCYARLDYLARTVGDGTAFNAALVQARAGRLDEAVQALDDMPAVTAVTSAQTMLKGFQDDIAQLQTAANFLLAFFAGIMAFAVIYNSASININEQKRDLACLRSLGYGRAEVARVATADIMPLGLLGTAAGLLLGHVAMQALARLYQTDLYRLPVIVQPRTFLAVSAWILAFQLFSRLFVARRARNIDIIRELKSRE
jgi:putative ABC transport system permease protein